MILKKPICVHVFQSVEKANGDVGEIMTMLDVWHKLLKLNVVDEKYVTLQYAAQNVRILDNNVMKSIL